MLNEVWTEPITQSSRSSSSSGIVERAVREDVGLGPGQHDEVVERVVERRDLVDPRLERLGRDVVAEAVRGRVVGDRQVLPAALARRLDHLLERLAPVGQRRVAVQVAAQVLERDELRQRALRRRLELAAALAQLRRDPLEAEPLVDLLLGRAAGRLAGVVVEDPVLAHVQPAPDGGLAQLHVVGLGAGEVLEHVAELVRLDHLQVDLHARVRHHPRAGVAALLHGLDELELRERGDERATRRWRSR